MDKLLGLLKSRKFWAALVAIAFVFVEAYAPDFPIEQDQVTSLVAVIVAYILGTALEDGLARK
ncbi:MAG TPA: hypothetical protein VJ417_05355 [Candidatus Glassbacteria bacterium]|nr:hypothetical protein [Candidatus Glassbacteria bacterium]